MTVVKLRTFINQKIPLKNKECGKHALQIVYVTKDLF